LQAMLGGLDIGDCDHAVQLCLGHRVSLSAVFTPLEVVGYVSGFRDLIREDEKRVAEPRRESAFRRLRWCRGTRGPSTAHLSSLCSDQCSAQDDKLRDVAVNRFLLVQLSREYLSASEVNAGYEGSFDSVAARFASDNSAQDDIR